MLLAILSEWTVQAIWATLGSPKARASDLWAACRAIRMTLDESMHGANCEQRVAPLQTINLSLLAPKLLISAGQTGR